MTTQSLALTPRKKTQKTTNPKFLPMCFSLGVVVRCRSVFTEYITLRPYGQRLLKLFCSWDRKKLETHVVVFLVANKDEATEGKSRHRSARVANVPRERATMQHVCVCMFVLYCVVFVVCSLIVCVCCCIAFVLCLIVDSRLFSCVVCSMRH